MNLHDQIRQKKAELDRIGSELDALLNQCTEEGGECSVCGTIICPKGDTLHFHHDGCPSCYAEHIP
jgi:hypothetical protein